MSNLTTPLAPTPVAPASAYRLPGAGISDAVSEKLAGKWIQPAMILIAALVVSLIFALVIYYSFAKLFETGGVLNSAGWSQTGDGLLFSAIIWLFMGMAGATIGFAFDGNMAAIGVAAAVSAFLLLFFWFSFTAINDGFQWSFIGWAVLAVLGGIAAAGYGFYALMKMDQNAKAVNTKFVKEEKEAIASRYTWSKGTLAGTVIFALALAVGFFQINTAA